MADAWRGSLLPLGRVAAPKPATTFYHARLCTLRLHGCCASRRRPTELERTPSPQVACRWVYRLSEQRYGALHRAFIGRHLGDRYCLRCDLPECPAQGQHLIARLATPVLPVRRADRRVVDLVENTVEVVGQGPVLVHPVFRHGLLIDYLIHQPIAAAAQLDLVTVGQGVQAVGFNSGIVQYFSQLLLELLAHCIPKFLPLL